MEQMSGSKIGKHPPWPLHAYELYWHLNQLLQCFSFILLLQSLHSHYFSKISTFVACVAAPSVGERILADTYFKSCSVTLMKDRCNITNSLVSIIGALPYYSSILSILCISSQILI